MPDAERTAGRGGGPAGEPGRQGPRGGRGPHVGSGAAVLGCRVCAVSPSIAGVDGCPRGGRRRRGPRGGGARLEGPLPIGSARHPRAPAGDPARAAPWAFLP